jgi:hypothetical protein
MLVEEVMSVVASLPTKPGIVLVHISEVLVMSVHVQKSSIDPAEWHEMRFAVIVLAVAELLGPGAYRAVPWTAAMAPMVETTRVIEGRIATDEAETGATWAVNVVGAALATESYSAPRA